jgi:hypothetical protein
MSVRCGSQTYLYVPRFSLILIIFVPTKDTRVTSVFRPGPLMWNPHQKVTTW